MPAPEPDPYATVDPSWGPPRPTGTSDPPGTPAPDRGPRWLPLVAVVLVTVLAAGGMFAAGRVGAATSATAASVYLPADGQAAYQQRSTTVGSETVTSTEVQESAVRTGPVGAGHRHRRLPARGDRPVDLVQRRAAGRDVVSERLAHLHHGARA
jgi:hypothetical protein